jgi:hypothetical protein
VRAVILALALLFIGLFGALTVADIVHNGLNALDVVSILVLTLFTVGIVGALRNPPRQ